MRLTGAGAFRAPATPAGRDRFVDLLRVVSIGAVVLGHWLIAGVVRGDGQLYGDNVLAASGNLAPGTWVFQVMPVFFMVGGFANARALRAPGASVSSFLGRRLARIVPPTVLFVAVWLVVAPPLDALGVPGAHEAAVFAGEPLWFLAVYLGLILLAPLQHAAHRRSRWAALAALPVLSVALDLLHLTGTAAAAADANYLVVFMFAQELGFWYADGAADRVPAWAALATAAGALAALVVLTTVGPYPVSMVGVPGEPTSNMSPPTICIVLLTVAQAALLLAIRPGAQRWLGRPRPWRLTMAANSVVLSVFLWHLTAFIGASAVLIGMGVPLPALGSAEYWLLKPAWLASALVVLALLLVLVGPLERRTVPPTPTRGPAWLMVTATFAAGAGFAAIAVTGFTDLLSFGGRVFDVPLSPAVGAVLLATGWLIPRVAGFLGSGAPR
jgi:peptidoglycan/LPS O-acetylase OafA/YrhL